MRFLADENLATASIRRLRGAGHDVAAVIEAMPGAIDERVLEKAVSEQRFIITFDRYFGELIFRANLESPPGILYLRFDPRSPVEPAERILQVLEIVDLELANQLTVVYRTRGRLRPLP